MKRQVAMFAALLLLSTACGISGVRSPVESSETPTLITTLLPSFTIQPQSSSRTPFCQGEPEYIRLGSSAKITVFSLSANQSIALYLDSKLAATGMTNMDGYASIDVLIPADETIGLHQASIYATSPPIIVTCQIRFWSDLVSSPTFSPASTLIPTSTLSSDQLTMTATQQPLEDRLGANCYYGSAQAIRLSPNSQWAEAICGPDSVIVIRIDGAKEWRVSSDSLIGPYTEHFVHVFHWSNDGAYAYIYANPHTDGYWEPFHQASALFRLNLETGQTSKVLEGEYYSFSFSPNDGRLAYIVTDQSPVVLNLRDVQTGVEESFEFDSKYNTGGGFLWAADSQRLLFSVTQFNENEREYVSTSIILWDKKKPGTTTLIKDHQEVLVPVAWIDETKILLRALYEDDPRFEFDLISNELKEISS